MLPIQVLQRRHNESNAVKVSAADAVDTRSEAQQCRSGSRDFRGAAAIGPCTHSATFVDRCSNIKRARCFCTTRLKATNGGHDTITVS